MAALLQYQDADGTWRQLIDQPEAWPETSCSGMFTFAMITGVKQGWLDEKTYGPAARKGSAWPDPASRRRCEHARRLRRHEQRTTVEYYLDRQRRTGDLHGQAPVLWCATALLR